MGVLQIKPGVQFTTIAPGGFRIISALDQTANLLWDLLITSACDGAHSGPDDPHHSGNAYDVRSHEFNAEEKKKLLDSVMQILGFDRFYGFLENPGLVDEHFHFQVRKGTTYP